jgi:PAS domain S-box-containing protein
MSEVLSQIPEWVIWLGAICAGLISIGVVVRFVVFKWLCPLRDRLISAAAALEAMPGRLASIERQLSFNNTTSAVIAEYLSLGMFHANASGGVTAVSPKWCTITGLAEGQAMGHGWISAIHADDRHSVVTDWEYCVRDQRMFTRSYRVVRGTPNETNPKVIDVICIAHPVRDGDGVYQGFTGILLERVDAEGTSQFSRDKALKAG